MGERFEFDFGGGEMQLQTWAAYSKSVRERFEQRLAEYETECRQLAVSKGLVLAPRQHSPSNIEWFVLYQFAGMSSTQIVKQIRPSNRDVDESAVLKGIKTAAKLVAWDSLRKSRNPKPKPGKLGS